MFIILITVHVSIQNFIRPLRFFRTKATRSGTESTRRCQFERHFGSLYYTWITAWWSLRFL